jgi:hypothetical protein
MKQNLPLSGVQNLFVALLLTAPLSACDSLFGQEVARLPINAISTPEREVMKEATLKLKKDDKIAVWSEMDMAYDGDAPVRFQMVLLQDGTPFQQLEIDPTKKNISVSEVKTTLNSKVNWRFSGKNTEVTIPANASYTFKARLIAGNNSTLQIKKAELVLKK